MFAPFPSDRAEFWAEAAPKLRRPPLPSRQPAALFVCPGHPGALGVLHREHTGAWPWWGRAAAEWGPWGQVGVRCGLKAPSEMAVLSLLWLPARAWAIVCHTQFHGALSG